MNALLILSMIIVLCVLTLTTTHAKTVTKKPSHAPTKSPIRTTSKPTSKPTKAPVYSKKSPTPQPSHSARTTSPTPTDGTQYPTATFSPTYVEDLDVGSTDDGETDDSSSGKLSTNIVVLVTILSIVGIAVLSAGGYFVWSLQYTLRASGTEQRPLMEKIKRRENPI